MKLMAGEKLRKQAIERTKRQIEHAKMWVYHPEIRQIALYYNGDRDEFIANEQVVLSKLEAQP